MADPAILKMDDKAPATGLIRFYNDDLLSSIRSNDIETVNNLLPISKTWPLDNPQIQFDSVSDIVLQFSSKFQIFGPFSNEMTAILQEELPYRLVVASLLKLAKEYTVMDDLVTDVCASLQTFKKYAEDILCQKGLSHPCFNLVYFSVIAEKYEKLLKSCVTIPRVTFKEIEVPLTKILLPLVEFSRFQSLVSQFRQLKWNLLNDSQKPLRCWDDLQRQFAKLEKIKQFFGTYCFGKVQLNLVEALLSGFTLLRLKIENGTAAQVDVASANVVQDDLYAMMKDIGTLDRILFYVDTALSLELDGNNSDLRAEKLVIERSLQVVGEGLKSTDDTSHLTPKGQSVLQRAGVPIQMVTSLRNLLSHCSTLLACSKSYYSDIDVKLLETVQHDLAKIKQVIFKRLRKLELNQVKMLLLEIHIEDETLGMPTKSLASIKDLLKQIESSSSLQTLKVLAYKISSIITEQDGTVSKFQTIKESIDEVLFLMQVKDASVDMKASQKAIKQPLQNFLQTDNERLLGFFEKSDVKSSITVISNARGIEDFYMSKFKTDQCSRSGDAPELYDIFVKQITEKLFDDQKFKKVKNKLKYGFGNALDVGFLKTAIDSVHAEILNALHENSLLSESKINYLLNGFLEGSIAGTEIFRLFGLEDKQNGEFQNILHEFRLNIARTARSKDVLAGILDNVIVMCREHLPEKEFAELDKEIKSRVASSLAKEKLICCCNGIRAVTGNEFHNTSNNVRIDDAQIIVQNWYRLNRQNCKSQILRVKDPYGEIINIISKEKGFLGTMESVQKFINALNTDSNCSLFLTRVFTFEIERYFEEQYYSSIELLKSFQTTWKLGETVNNSKLNIAMEMAVLNSLTTLKEISSKKIFRKLEMLIQATITNLFNKKNCKPAMMSLRNYLAHGDILGDVVNANAAEIVHLAAKVLAEHGLTILEIKKMLTDADTSSFVKSWIQGTNHDLGAYLPSKHKRQFEIIKETLFWNESNLKQVLVTLVMSDDGFKEVEYRQIFDLEILSKLTESEFINAVGLDNVKMANFCIRRGVLFPSYGNVKCALHFAAENGSLRVTRLLLNLGFQINLRCQSNNTPLHVATYCDKSEIVQTLLERNADANATDINGYTPLHAVARTGNAAIMKQLIQNGAHVNKLSRMKRTPLQLAALNGRIEAVGILLKYGSEVDLSDQWLITPLLFAVSEGHDQIVALLSANGANVNGNAESKFKPLWAAIKKGHDSVAKHLISNGADINFRDYDSETPLHHACYYGRAEMCEILAKHGASLDAVNGLSFSPLHIAAILGNVRLANVLLQEGAGMDVVDKEGWVALHFAVYKDHMNMAEMLINKGANVNFGGKNGQTPLHLAIERENLSMTRFLLQHGANVDDVHVCIQHNKSSECYDKSILVRKHWPLQRAVQHGNAALVDLLLEFGADINKVEQLDITVLHYAACFGYSKITSMLLKNNANINAINSLSCTPLHYCFQQGHHQVAKILLQNGAATDIPHPAGQPLVHLASILGNCDLIKLLVDHDVTIFDINRQGINAFQCAMLYMQLEAMQYLLKLGFDINGTGKHKKTALHWACDLESSENEQIGIVDLDKGIRLQMVQFLLQNKADVNAKDFFGKIPMHYSAKIGDIDVIRLFLEHNADVNAKDSFGYTPLKIAEEYGQIECCEYLIAISNDNGIKLQPNSVNQVKKPASVIDPSNTVECHEQMPAWVEQLTNAVHEKHNYLVRKILIDNKDKLSSTDLNKYNLLHIAVANNDSTILGQLLSTGMYIDYIDSHENIAPLHLAVHFGHLEVIKFLLEKGADINLPTKGQNQLAIHLAVNNGNIQVLKLLLENEVIILDAMDINNVTPLFLACQAGHTEIVHELLNKGASVQMANKDGDSPIHMAILQNDISLIDDLLDHGADPHAPGKEGNTPLHYSMISGNISIAKKLLTYGTPVDSVNQANYTPLHVSIFHGNMFAANFLIDHGSCVNNVVVGTDSPLHLAVDKGITRLCEILIQKQCDINAKNGKLQTPLHVAASKGYHSIVQMLLQHDATIDPPDSDGYTPLLQAVEQCHYDIMCLLLEKGANVNAFCHENWSVLHKAVTTSDTSIIEKLLEQGANIDIVGKQGWTPLHLAVFNGSTNSVIVLVNNKANINLTDHNKDSAIHIACKHCVAEDILQSLIAAGGNVNMRDKEGDTPLMLATKKNKGSAIQILLESGSDMNASNKSLTALHIAICCHHYATDAAKILLQHGAMLTG